MQLLDSFNTKLRLDSQSVLIGKYKIVSGLPKLATKITFLVSYRTGKGLISLWTTVNVLSYLLKGNQ